MTATAKLTYITSKWYVFENSYGNLDLMTDGERLYLRTNAGKQRRQVAFPFEAKETLVEIINSLRPIDFMSGNKEGLEQLRTLYTKAKSDLAPYTSLYQPGDEKLVELMLFSPLVYTAKPPREPELLKFRLWFRDGGEPTSPKVTLEEGEADEIYINRRALELKRGINRPLIMSIFNEESGKMEKKYQITSSGFFPLDKKGYALPGKLLNPDGLTFTKKIDLFWGINS